jgi:hypothetical protein
LPPWASTAYDSLPRYRRNWMEGAAGGRPPWAGNAHRAPSGVSRAEQRTPPMARFPDSRIAAMRRLPRPCGVSAEPSDIHQRVASRLQWRDRAGFSPTSLTAGASVRLWTRGDDLASGRLEAAPEANAASILERGFAWLRRVAQVYLFA